MDTKNSSCEPAKLDHNDECVCTTCTYVAIKQFHNKMETISDEYQTINSLIIGTSEKSHSRLQFLESLPNSCLYYQDDLIIMDIHGTKNIFNPRNDQQEIVNNIDSDTSDLTDLYPNMIISFNVTPDMIINAEDDDEIPGLE